jgi:putative spermidine/putrescine transport system ATP-binding protein
MVFQNYTSSAPQRGEEIAFGKCATFPKRNQEGRASNCSAQRTRRSFGQMSAASSSAWRSRAKKQRPPLVLMDEPLSNLTLLRLEMRTEIRRLHQSLVSPRSP